MLAALDAGNRPIAACTSSIRTGMLTAAYRGSDAQYLPLARALVQAMLWLNLLIVVASEARSMLPVLLPVPAE